MLIKSLLKNLLRYTTYNTWTLLVNVPQELNQYVFCLSRKQKSTKLFDRATVSRPTTLQAHAFHLEVKRWPKKVSYQGKLEIAFFFLKKKPNSHQLFEQNNNRFMHQHHKRITVPCPYPVLQHTLSLKQQAEKQRWKDVLVHSSSGWIYMVYFKEVPSMNWSLIAHSCSCGGSRFSSHHPQSGLSCSARFRHAYCTHTYMQT